mmetsp:Transcript_17185/g.49774  ORF Transcript_17185/g.49774 Transcript_17185/m.49774 type:complete len:205 (-) Transcript_17185:1899-2513(-)
MTTPRFNETQSGSAAPQSAHVGFAPNICWTFGFFGGGDCIPSSSTLRDVLLEARLSLLRKRGRGVSTASPVCSEESSISLSDPVLSSSLAKDEACCARPSIPIALADVLLGLVGDIPESLSIESVGIPPWANCRSMHDLIPSTHRLYSCGPQACSIIGAELGLKTSKQNLNEAFAGPPPFCFGLTSRTLLSTISQTFSFSSEPE